MARDDPAYPAAYAAACDARDWVWSVFERLGLKRNAQKGQPDPTQLLNDHLGYGIDSARGLFLLTAKREAGLAAQATELICRSARQRRLVCPRRLASFAGLAQSSYLALPLGRFMLRSLYDDLATRRDWRRGVRLSAQSLADLRWWAELRGSKHVGRAIWRSHETRLMHCDASDLGWGGAVDMAAHHAPSHGFWSPEELEWHITRKELVAVRLTVEHFLPC